MMLRYALPWLFLSAPLLAGCAENAAPLTPIAQPTVPIAPADPITVKLDEAARHALDKVPLLGLQVLVLKDGKPLLDKGYGFTSLDRKAPVDQRTRFGIGSMTKQFTAAAVLALVDEGKVQLSDPVTKFVPEVTPQISIAELLNQTAGLVEYAWATNEGKTRDEIVTVIANQPPDFDPGSKYHYSNSNYFILGKVVEAASKQSYSDYLRTHFFAPLGMTSSSYCHDDSKRMASGSRVKKDQLVRPSDIEPDFYFSAGGICSTTADILAWQTALYGGKVLSASSLAFLTTPGKPTDGSKSDYGAGTVIQERHHRLRWWHNGAVPSGFESEMSFFPNDHLQVITLSNTLTDHAEAMGKLGRALAKIALGVADPPAQDQPLPADAEKRFLGQFHLDKTRAEMTIKDGKLHALVDGSNDLELLYQGDDRFLVASNHFTEYRFVVKDGRTASVEITSDGDSLGRLERIVEVEMLPAPPPSKAADTKPH